MGAVVAVIRILEINVENNHVYPDRIPFNPLVNAAAKGHEAVIKILLDSPYVAALAQGRIKKGFNALAIAAWYGHAGVVSILLASPHASELIQRNYGGLNALMLAAFKNQAAVTRTLLEFGFAEEQLAGIYCERSTIDNVIKKGFLTVAEVLIRHGAVATRSKVGGQSTTSTDPGQ
jgi:ankyrin repeat protein